MDQGRRRQQSSARGEGETGGVAGTGMQSAIANLWRAGIDACGVVDACDVLNAF